MTLSASSRTRATMRFAILDSASWPRAEASASLTAWEIAAVSAGVAEEIFAVAAATSGLTRGFAASKSIAASRARACRSRPAASSR